MNNRSQHANVQKWTLTKVACYILYRLFAKHLPDELGPIGRWSDCLRRILCRPLLKEAKNHFGISPGVDFGNGSCLVMKDHANIGNNSLIGSGGGTVTIGRHVMMGHQCVVITQNHKYVGERYEGEEIEDVLIDDYAWLGHRVIVLPGVRIGKHAIVGAGAVVSKDVPDYGVAVGNPAKVVKYRKQ